MAGQPTALSNQGIGCAGFSWLATTSPNRVMKYQTNTLSVIDTFTLNLGKPTDMVIGAPGGDEPDGGGGVDGEGCGLPGAPPNKIGIVHLLIEQ